MKPYTIRKSLSILVSAMMLGTSMAAIADEKVVKITEIVDHPALDAIRDGVKDSLKEQGFVDGKNLKWEYQSAQGNQSIAGQIARKFVGDHPDVIVAVTTTSAQAVAAATRSIPLVFTGVTDPVAAKLIKEWAPTKTNITGVSNYLDPEQQVALIKKIAPNAKRVGMVYSPGEANSVVVMNQLKAVLPKHGMTLVEGAAPRSVDVGTAAKSMVGKADVFYISTDNNVISSLEAIVKVANDAKIPFIASDADSVKRGALAAMSLDYYTFGKQTGEVVGRILKGEKPGDIPPETSKNLAVYLNASAAQKQGVTLSKALLDSAKEVYK